MKNIINLAKLLSDENRLKIIRLLAEKDMCVCELMEILRVPQARVSQHLLRLRAEGLVSDRRESQWVIYSLNHEALSERMKSLDEFINGDSARQAQMIEEFERLDHLENRGLLCEKLTCEKNDAKRREIGAPPKKKLSVIFVVSTKSTAEAQI